MENFSNIEYFLLMANISLEELEEIKAHRNRKQTGMETMKSRLTIGDFSKKINEIEGK